MFRCVHIVISRISVFIPILKLLLVVYGCTIVENYDKIYMKIEGGLDMSQRCSNFMINFLIRMAVGVMLILVINGFFVSKEIPVRVGLNPITMAASGTLGVPGVALLYGVAFYESR